MAETANAASSKDIQIDWRGHLKGQGRYQAYRDGSVYQPLGFQEQASLNSDTRLNFTASRQQFSVEVDYQLLSQVGDEVELSRRFVEAANDPISGLFIPGILNDDRRLFDFTHTLSQGERHQWVHRLDRANLAYIDDQWVVKLGRQAISWGNGLMYNPMDIFNPFSPTQVDTEYKSGDDMLYGQYLTQDGDDLQMVWVVRRDLLGKVNAEHDSIAAKYHLFWQPDWLGQPVDEPIEVDFLLAEHFRDYIAAVGLTQSLGDALWRTDIMLTHVAATQIPTTLQASPTLAAEELPAENVASLVSNLSYSWLWQPLQTGGGFNMNGSLEYFYNGFGQADGEYSPEQLVANPALLSRLARGELYSLGRHYVAASVTMELTPLWLITPTALVNLSDHSALLQLVSQHDIQQNLQLLFSLNVPVGPIGTEFGGLELAGVPLDLQTDSPLHIGQQVSAQLQLAWYF
ncbi:hypothetical protein GCM10009332_14090 [Shewanella gelidii]|uniref:Uncharacterized protein n=2 Tax=Shewanella gelidii TaxID=1642821 RepID=A0A917JMR3_9GAMM|nr:hypothetical protein GCM10009332_14090 [Shewanella gelidii]